jgi:Ca2+-binding RTX toxin-like protein
MAGGAGDDTYEVDAAGDVVTEAAASGTDTVRASINYVLGANVENLELLGSADLTGTGNTLANQITGNSGHNQLFGKAGNDALIGNAGDDRLNGGTGNDVLTGGVDADSFVFDTAPSATTNVDHITDFASDDFVLLENAVFVGLGLISGPLNPGMFVAGPNFTGGQDANDRIVYDTTDGELYYDANGNAPGGATLFAVLDGAPAVVASDFFVI